MSAFRQRLSNGGFLVVGEGYNFELERRGYLQHGAFIPEVVLKHPEVVKTLHEEFVHAGSDVVIACTYYGHTVKMADAGLEDQVETLNRKALTIARNVARATGTLFGGDICNTCVYRRDDEDAKNKARAMFKEQIEWAVQEGTDFIIAETFSELGEAMLALECIKRYGSGVPAVVNLVASTRDTTFDGVPYAEACRQLEEAGADVVGLNCGRGPETLLPLIREVRKTCRGPIACLPVGYHTTPESPTFQSLKDPNTGEMAFPLNLSSHSCNRSEIEKYAKACKEIGVQMPGICCGNCSHNLRIIAEVYGRCPPGSAYSPDMSKHHMLGGKSSLKSDYITQLSKWKTGL